MKWNKFKLLLVKKKRKKNTEIPLVLSSKACKPQLSSVTIYYKHADVRVRTYVTKPVHICNTNSLVYLPLCIYFYGILLRQLEKWQVLLGLYLAPNQILLTSNASSKFIAVKWFLSPFSFFSHSVCESILFSVYIFPCFF